MKPSPCIDPPRRMADGKEAPPLSAISTGWRDEAFRRGRRGARHRWFLPKGDRREGRGRRRTGGSWGTGRSAEGDRDLLKLLPFGDDDVARGWRLTLQDEAEMVRARIERDGFTVEMVGDEPTVREDADRGDFIPAARRVHDYGGGPLGDVGEPIGASASGRAPGTHRGHT